MPEALVAEKLPHVRPVLLFAVRVVVLPVSPAARPGQMHRTPAQVSHSGSAARNNLLHN